MTITIPSYKRAGRVTTLDFLGDAFSKSEIIVGTQNKDDYEAYSNLYGDKATIFNRECGFDLFDFYKKYSISTGYLRLNRKVKRPFIENMKNLCDELGMRFYVSDAHFKELCCNGSCCGLPQSWNYSRGQFCEALQIAKEKGSVRWSDIKDDVEQLHNYEYRRAEGFNTKSCEHRSHFEGMTMAEYMHWLWNNPQNGQNPYKMFEGVMRPDGKDENGDLIYVYDETRTI